MFRFGPPSGFSCFRLATVNTEVKVHGTAEQKYISWRGRWVDGFGFWEGSARGITPSLLRRSNLEKRAES